MYNMNIQSNKTLEKEYCISKSMKALISLIEEAVSGKLYISACSKYCTYDIEYRMLRTYNFKYVSIKQFIDAK